MLKKCLLTAALALLAVGVGKPAAAAPVFLEPYGELFGARTHLASWEDARVVDALAGQDSRSADPEERFAVSPFFRRMTLRVPGPDADVVLLGIGVAYANINMPDHPWSVNLNFLHGNIDTGGFDRSSDGFDLNGKFVLWQPENRWLPVASIVGRFQTLDGIGDRWDVLLAIDQQIHRRLFATANIGWSWVSFDAGGISDRDDYTAGLGVTWAVTPRISISADYQFDSDTEHLYGVGGDWWSLSASWAIDRTSSIRVGGGKGNTWFANYIAKFDW
jgi:opacity protein-like surface antigen